MTRPESLRLTTARTAGHALTYALAGGAGAELVVLIHPAFGDHTCFTPQLDPLAARYRVAAVDLPGQGAAQGAGAPTRIVDTAGLFNERRLAFLRRHEQAAPAGQIQPPEDGCPEVA